MYTIQPISENFVSDWKHKTPPFIIVDSDGFDAIGEAFTEAKATKICSDLNK